MGPGVGVAHPSWRQSRGEPLPGGGRAPRLLSAPLSFRRILSLRVANGAIRGLNHIWSIGEWHDVIFSSFGDTGARSRETDLPVETQARSVLTRRSKSPATARNCAAQSRPRRPLRQADRPNPERARSRATSAVPMGCARVFRSDPQSDARVSRAPGFIPRTFTRAAWIELWQG